MRPVADVAKELEPGDVVVVEGEVFYATVRLVACGGKRGFGYLQAQYKSEDGKWCYMHMSHAMQALLVLLARERD